MHGKWCELYLILSVLTITGTLFAQEICNPIDVMTSPTKKFSTLNGSQYCDTSAKIVWKDAEDVGTRRIDYGNSTSYGQSITLTGINGTATMSSLTPNTVYYWRVYRYFQGETVTTPADSFTTTGGVSVIKFPVITNAVSVKIGKTVISFPFYNGKTFALSIISLNGSVVMKKLFSVNGSDIKLNFNKPGTYICKAEFKSGAIFKRIVLQ